MAWAGGRKIPVEDAGDVVDAVGAPQLFVAGGVGEADLLVVCGVGRIVAPAVIRGDGFNRHGAARGLAPVGAV